jgi:predicted PurR-regulated permease PerM
MAINFFRLRFLGYWLIVLILFLAGWLELATPLITVLFAYFILTKLQFTRSKWAAVILFLILVGTIFYGFGFFVKQAVVALPRIADSSIPGIYRYAEAQGVHLPFDDEQSLKTFALEYLRTKLGELGKFAKIATKEFVFVAIGLVVSVSLFLNPAIDLERKRHRIRRNLYSFACDEVSARFRSFFDSFASVMGAQMIISVLNTGFTAAYLLVINLPYTLLVIGLTFLCGLLPIVGNLISNSIIVAVSFTVAPKLAIWSLIFLIILHKLEYFLNSKIIGDRIKNPVWLTLLGLIIGERLMGIPGMILAPVVLHFIKVEVSSIEIPQTVPGESRPAEEQDFEEKVH